MIQRDDAPELRLAVPGDVAEMQRIADAAYRPYIERIGRKPAPMVADFAGAVERGVTTVAVLDAQLIGYVIAEPEADAMQLQNVAVDPTFSGRGLGRRLITAVEASAARAQLRAVTLYTNVKMIENLALYSHLGYRETGRRREDGFDRVYFAKELLQPKR